MLLYLLKYQSHYLETEIHCHTVSALEGIASERFGIHVVKRRDCEEVSPLQSEVEIGDMGLAEHL